MDKNIDCRALFEEYQEWKRKLTWQCTTISVANHMNLSSLTRKIYLEEKNLLKN